MYVLLWMLVAVVSGTLHFWSVEYDKLEQKYGVEKASRLVKLYGGLSGDLEMLFLVGLWVLPQPRFKLPFWSNGSFEIPLIHFSIPYFHLVVALPFIVSGVWLIVQALRQMGNELSIEHRKPERLITNGVFSIVRHPQNLGGAILHIGMCLVFSAWYALLFTPVFFVFDYLIAVKEEKELLRVFGKEYEAYQRKVSMFVPQWRRQFRS